MGKTSSIPADGRSVPRGVRWSLWLLAGVVFGVGIGFTFGLARPRVSE